jgi:hypothetical protein
MNFSDLILKIGVPLVIAAGSAFALIKILMWLYKSDGLLSVRDRMFKAISLALNGIWIVLFFPLLPITIMAGVFASMTTTGDTFLSVLVAVSAILFLR